MVFVLAIVAKARPSWSQPAFAHCDLAFFLGGLSEVRESISTYAEIFPEIVNSGWPMVNFVEPNFPGDATAWRVLAHRALIDLDSPFNEAYLTGYMKYKEQFGHSEATLNAFTANVHRVLSDLIGRRAFKEDKIRQSNEDLPVGPHITHEEVELAIEKALEIAP